MQGITLQVDDSRVQNPVNSTSIEFDWLRYYKFYCEVTLFQIFN